MADIDSTPNPAPAADPPGQPRHPLPRRRPLLLLALLAFALALLFLAALYWSFS
jgi:hypothetical protein